jgi:putative PIN family toxin of toxin-antitoxin system
VRAVLDPNVIVSALISPGRSPARLLHHWITGGYELVVSPMLLTDLSRTLCHPTIRERLSEVECDDLLEVIRRQAEFEDDGTGPAIDGSGDAGDDYLIALAAASGSLIVTGDQHLLELRDRLPVMSPSEFLLEVESHP